MEHINNRYLIFYILVFFVVTLSQQNLSQTNFSNELPSGLSKSSTIIVNENVASEIKVEKNYWLPAVEIIGLNFAVWGYHRYLSGENWSNISWTTIKDNLKYGFEWDVDGYLTNQFLHPYHGSNYYNAARSNGLGFWESVPYAFFGSLTWEYFMENERPSYNDIVNTPVTGITLGEISFRVSNLIIDESTIGFERFLREFTSTLIDPMQGLNRMIRGDMWRAGASSEEQDFGILISLGAHNVFFDNTFNKSRSYVHLGVDLNYGNLFAVSDHKKPFDYFTVHTDVNIGPTDNIVGIFASGVLWDKRIKLFDNSKNMLGIYKEVDILINTIYKLSTTNVTGQMINTILLSSKLSMINHIGVSAILMGATNSQYASVYGKDYNIGPGASAKIGIKISLKDFGNVFANYKRYWIHTLSGAESEEFVGLLNTGISLNVFNKTELGLNLLLYERYGDYKYFPNTQNSNAAIRLFLSQNI